eukprot:COSAG02_NODE_1798_length_10901_cov_2.933161_1_plen_76_part_00
MQSNPPQNTPNFRTPPLKTSRGSGGVLSVSVFPSVIYIYYSTPSLEVLVAILLTGAKKRTFHSPLILLSGGCRGG